MKLNLKEIISKTNKACCFATDFKKFKKNSLNHFSLIIRILIFTCTVFFLAFLSWKIFFTKSEKKPSFSPETKVNLSLFEKLKKDLEKKEIETLKDLKNPFEN